MIEANDALPINQDIHWYRGNAVLFVVGRAHGNRFVTQETVVGVPYLDEMAQLFGRRGGPAGFHEAVSPCRRDNCQTLRTVLAEDLGNRRAIGLAVCAPMCPKEQEDDLSLDFLGARHAGTEMQAT